MIEIMDVSEDKKIYCRYNRMFLRESIYQSMRYKAVKKGLHEMIEKFFQAQPSTICVDH